jgi:hypothetical protein
MFLSGRFEPIDFNCAERFRIPLPLVAGENLQGFSADAGNPVKGKMKSFAH